MKLKASVIRLTLLLLSWSRLTTEPEKRGGRCNLEKLGFEDVLSNLEKLGSEYVFSFFVSVLPCFTDRINKKV